MAELGVVAVDRNRAFVTWEDVSPNGIDLETLFAASTDGGANFSNPINISNNPGRVLRKSINSCIWNQCVCSMAKL
jgi:hypothetical protein